jgi:hypothetical protein
MPPPNGLNGTLKRKGSIEMFWGAAQQSAEFLKQAASNAADRLEQEGLLSPDSTLTRRSSSSGNINGGSAIDGTRKSSLDVLDRKLSSWFSPSPTSNQLSRGHSYDSPGNSRGSSPSSTPGTSPRLGPQAAPAMSTQDKFAFYNALGKGGGAGSAAGRGMGTRKLSHLSGNVHAVYCAYRCVVCFVMALCGMGCVVSHPEHS